MRRNPATAFLNEKKRAERTLVGVCVRPAKSNEREQNWTRVVTSSLGSKSGRVGERAGKQMRHSHQAPRGGQGQDSRTRRNRQKSVYSRPISMQWPVASGDVIEFVLSTMLFVDGCKYLAAEMHKCARPWRSSEVTGRGYPAGPSEI